MAILCCVAQKGASAAQLPQSVNSTKSCTREQSCIEDGPNTSLYNVHASHSHSQPEWEEIGMDN
jgi:hypothetical protein